jgi:hypothetical protein
MPTRTVRLFQADVEAIEELSRLNPEATFASHANEVLHRAAHEGRLGEAAADALDETREGN